MRRENALHSMCRAFFSKELPRIMSIIPKLYLNLHPIFGRIGCGAEPEPVVEYEGS